MHLNFFLFTFSPKTRGLFKKCVLVWPNSPLRFLHVHVWCSSIALWRSAFELLHCVIFGRQTWKHQPLYQTDSSCQLSSLLSPRGQTAAFDSVSNPEGRSLRSGATRSASLFFFFKSKFLLRGHIINAEEGSEAGHGAESELHTVIFLSDFVRFCPIRQNHIPVEEQLF